MEIFHASERFRKSKLRFFMLLNVSERANGVFCASEHFRKSKWRKIIVSVNDISVKKRK